MVHIRRFEVEEWMDRLETTPGVLNVAETCCESVSLSELMSLSTGPSSNPLDIAEQRLGYGQILGSDITRQNVAATYSDGSNLISDDIVLTQGAIAANFLLLYSMIGLGDHVICVYPTYQQLYEVPRSLGAEVTLWKLKENMGYVPDTDELADMIQQNTKVRLSFHFAIV